jgi:hypothetical protein
MHQGQDRCIDVTEDSRSTKEIAKATNRDRKVIIVH